jgi:hypothetical protein
MPLNVNPGFLPRMFVESLAASYKALPHLQVIQARSSALINMARTDNIKAFLESDAEWALSIDSDMAWEPDAIIRLLKTAKEKQAKVVSGMTFMHQKGRVIPHAYAYVPHNGTTVLAPYAVLPSTTEPFRVEAVGGACLLVHRDVYEDVRRAVKGTTAYYWQEEVYSPKNDQMKGEDLVFSERMRAVGYDIWYEPRAIFMHEKKRALIGLDDYLTFLNKTGIPHREGGFVQHGDVHAPDAG